ncbi:MAG: ABC transporter permease subunit [Deltaproteobacteria bacterium]|nr:ABC transporter permease subunit [Deltaproteobacteria bacterium]
MRQAALIFKKEFKDYFASPIAYIVIAIFLALTGWLFFSAFFIFDQADLRRFFNLMPLLLALVVPLITMRLFSEERNVGSYELLLTLPVTFRDIIVGKYLAAVAFVAAMLLPTLSYPIFISFIGDLDWGVAIAGYIGAVLLGAAYAAIGIFASSLTRNQIIACITAMVVCVVLSIMDQMLFFFPQSVLDVVGYVSANAHFANIAKGIVDSRDLIYFLSVVFLGLYATHLVMEEK